MKDEKKVLEIAYQIADKAKRQMEHSSKVTRTLQRAARAARVGDQATANALKNDADRLKLVVFNWEDEFSKLIEAVASARRK